jgi:hypothetical protein
VGAGWRARATALERAMVREEFVGAPFVHRPC